MPWVCPSLHRNQGGLTASDTVGLVVEYAPATGETRVRFPDGVASLQTKRPFCFASCSLVLLSCLVQNVQEVVLSFLPASNLLFYFDFEPLSKHLAID